jgi:3-deoxy-7-phosphoheptulonate synthase
MSDSVEGMQKPEGSQQHSWRRLPGKYQPVYRDTGAYDEVLRQLSSLPPVVFPGEIRQLQGHLAEAAAGRRFILHGGDCVERFVDCNAESIANKLKILLQMSIVLSYAARKPVLRIGRIAGQYFKPRSSETERIDDAEVPTFRGDAINGFAPGDRDPDPRRLLEAYFHSTATLNYIRSMIDGGFADLHHPYAWNLDSMERSSKWADYQAIVDNILDAIHFMESFGGVRDERLGRIEFYTSHEGLHLGYEEALVRSDDAGSYDTSAHLLWIGERTRDLPGAHVEFFRGIDNPIGVKVSGAADSQEIVELCGILNPENLPGRLMLITRMGADAVESRLPQLLSAVESTGHKVAWMCDPMHGNTLSLSSGRKTRPFSHVLRELEATFEVHRFSGTVLAGVHFELTGEDVTECTGGAIELLETDLDTNYQTYCDPRLNYSQSMEMAFLISRFLREERPGG